jgi:hypothetical protein
MIDAEKLNGSIFYYATYPGVVLRKFYTLHISNYFFKNQDKQQENIIVDKRSFWKDDTYIINYKWSVFKINFQIILNLVFISISSLALVFVARRLSVEGSSINDWLSILFYWFGYSATCHALPTRIEYNIFKELVAKTQSKFKIIYRFEKAIMWVLVLGQYVWIDLGYSLLFWWLVNTYIPF